MKLKYPTPDDLAKIIRKKGKGCKLFIRDLKKAYRQLFLDPKSIPTVGYVFDNELYFDVSLSMGSKSSAYCCQRTTDCITFIFHEEGFENVNYLDDLGGAEVEEKAAAAFEKLGQILLEMGIWESSSKSVPPTTIGTFLGILYNTLTMTMELTPERLVELRNLLHTWLNKGSATLKEVQQVLGKLAFACSTVRSGRIFMSKIINMLKGFPKTGSRRLGNDFKRDIKWWYCFMQEFDGISIIPNYNWTKPDEELATDSCLTGCGGWLNGNYFHGKYPDWLTSQTNVSINELETMAIIVAFKLWGSKLKNRNFLLFCDNKASCDIINTGKAKNRFAQDCLREICYICAQNNMVVKLVHRIGSENRIPDLLSRFHLGEKFRNQFFHEPKGTRKTVTKIRDSDFKFTHTW